MKRYAPATLRNREPIADVLSKELPKKGLLLEIAAGTGEHAAFLAERFPDLDWLPTDQDAEAIASIAAWRVEGSSPNMLAPLVLSAASPDWPVKVPDAILRANKQPDVISDVNSDGNWKCDACLCINMVHISKWGATIGLFRGCSQVLTTDAPLILYGPYLEEGIETAPSNLDFDRSLKMRNPVWGLRKLEDVDRLAEEWGFQRTARYQMPANNIMLVYRRKPTFS